MANGGNGTTAGDDAPANIAYWTYNEGADENVVNGKVWPNLNVQRQQYRFRILMGGEHAALRPPARQQQRRRTTPVPFTIIGSDGGYLPAPQTVTDVQMGITERADILVDFSQFAAGTKIVMVDLNYGSSALDNTKFTSCSSPCRAARRCTRRRCPRRCSRFAKC